jgi:hypothetical protein
MCECMTISDHRLYMSSVPAPHPTTPQSLDEACAPLLDRSEGYILTISMLMTYACCKVEIAPLLRLRRSLRQWSHAPMVRRARLVRTPQQLRYIRSRRLGVHMEA